MLAARLSCLLLVALSALSSAVCAAERPNIVVFLADDHGYYDSTVYGSSSVKTPNMQALAQQGMTFNRAFVASPSCGPSRAALLSGLMPARNGAEPNHTMPRPGTLTMVRRLQDLGYEVVAFGKVGHGTVAELAGFDQHADYAHQRKPEGLEPLVRDYLQKRKSDKPLCLMVGDHRSHVAWTDKRIYEPGAIKLPVKSIDTPETREHFARYLSDVTGLDGMIGKVDQLAKEYFGKEDYLFLYSSDHGTQWPFGKWNLYDTGIRTPLIVRWPGHIKAGIRTDAMVSWIDVLPTLIDLAGGKAPEDIDGRSFASVLTGKSDSHRDVIFSTHSGDGNRNVYPIRAVRTAQYKYIRNLRPDSFHSNHSDIDRKPGAGAYWDSWDAAEKKDSKAAALVARYYQRPAVEFYDVVNDPNEERNLADDPKYKPELEKLSAQLDDWMKTQVDTQKAFRDPYPATGPRPRNVVANTKAAD